MNLYRCYAPEYQGANARAPKFIHAVTSFEARKVYAVAHYVRVDEVVAVKADPVSGQNYYRPKA